MHLHQKFVWTNQLGKIKSVEENNEEMLGCVL